jgi:proteasome lid subunit RPN8/RPN11
VTGAVTEVIAVSAAVVAAIVRHARQAAPRECCGLLAGAPGDIDEAVPTRNLADSPFRFEIDPVEHIRLNRRLRGTSRQVLGAYHSHPSSAAVPSVSDVAEAHDPAFLHVIVSLVDAAHPAIRAYRVIRGTVVELSLRTASI